MSDFDWKAVVKTVAPGIATALGGPLAGMAVQALGNALGIDQATQEKVEAAIKGATPEDMLKIKSAEQAFQVRMRELNIDLDKAYLGDTQDARSRDVKLAQAGYHNTRANNLLVFAGLLIVVILSIAVWRSPLDEYVKGILTLILGRALGYVDQGYNFEFGSTRQSHVKDDTIENLSSGR